MGRRCEILKTLTHGADIRAETFPPSVVPELGEPSPTPVCDDMEETYDDEELPRPTGGPPRWDGCLLHREHRRAPVCRGGPPPPGWLSRLSRRRRRQLLALRRRAPHGTSRDPCATLSEPVRAQTAGSTCGRHPAARPGVANVNTALAPSVVHGRPPPVVGVRCASLVRPGPHPGRFHS